MTHSESPAGTGSRNARNSLWTAIAGCLIALALWNMGEWAWKRYGWQLFWFLFVAWLPVVVAYRLRKWWRGRKGLDQWPSPHGRYYDKWGEIVMRGEECGEYYEWLARKMGNREPWETWAKWDKERRK